MNDVMAINWEKISKVLPEFRKVANDRPYSVAEISKLLEKVDHRGRIIILLMASSGMREGAIHSLKISDMEHIQDIYKITVYKNDPAEYYTSCSPECAKAIDDYLEYRKRCGEVLNPSAPILRQRFNKLDPVESANPKVMGRGAIQDIIYRAINDCGLREKRNLVNGEKRILHEVMQSHGLRKFYNTQIVMAGMPVLYAEMLMGHRSGLAMQSYVKPTVAKILEEYLKVVDSVIINEENKLRRKVETLTEKQDEIQKMKDKHEEEMKSMREDMNKQFGQVMGMIQENPKLANVKPEVSYHDIILVLVHDSQ
jgi:integrase